MSDISNIEPRILLATAALPAPAHAEDVTDYTITVDTSATKVTTLAAAPDAVNTETSTAVAPRTSTFTGVADRFTYTFPANSVTFLKIRQR